MIKGKEYILFDQYARFVAHYELIKFNKYMERDGLRALVVFLVGYK